MPNLKDKRILITGGAGFIGSHIAELLLDEGCREIVAVDNLVRGHIDNLRWATQTGRVKLVLGDIRDAELMDGLVRNADIVFHQAALRITHCVAEPHEAIEVMVDATFDLLNLCVRHKVEKVVMASSASIYGAAEEYPTTESHHPYGNRTLYGAAKSFGEGLLRSFNDMYGLDYVALRYFNVYGPRMDTEGKYTEVMIRWLERLSRGEAPVIFGDGSQTMDFVHVRDVARANVLAARSDATDVALNVASGTETSLLDLARSMAKAMEHSDLVPVHGPERSVNPVPRRLASTALAREKLNFETTISLDEGLRDLVSWWRLLAPHVCAKESTPC
jgi:UDP-glucose 4-epimerase